MFLSYIYIYLYVCEFKLIKQDVIIICFVFNF